MNVGSNFERPPATPGGLLDLPVVTAADWEQKIGPAETAGSAMVIFYRSSFANASAMQHLIERLTADILPHARQHRVFRFFLDEQPEFATNLVRKLGIWNVTVRNCGLLWSGSGSCYVFGDSGFVSIPVLDQTLRALAENRGIKFADQGGLAASNAAIPPLPLTADTTRFKKRRPNLVVVGLVLLLAGGFTIFSGEAAYVSQCRSLWWERSGRIFPAVDVSYQRAGAGEMTRRSDDRLVGYYTDFSITLKFDNFGQQGRIHLQCVANSQKTFVYMKTNDRDWIGGSPGPIGTRFVRANGTYSFSPPALE